MEFTELQEDLLGKCRVCDHQVSKQAWNCPHCGQPSPTEEVKAYLDFSGSGYHDSNSQYTGQSALKTTRS